MMKEMLLKNIETGDIRKSIENYQSLSENQKKNMAINRNLKGDKVNKIIEEVAIIKNRTELLRQ